MDEIYFEKLATNGRPKYILNDKGKEIVEKLSEYMCTDEEIASVLGVSVDTLHNANNEDAYSECKQKGFNKGKASLRRRQYEVACSGNTSMLIWLGKQYLGQSEKVEQVIEDKSAQALELVCNAIKGVKNGREDGD